MGLQDKNTCYDGIVTPYVLNLTDEAKKWADLTRRLKRKIC